LGYSSARAQLLTVPPYALATILTVIVAVVSERLRKRAAFIMGSSSVGILGYILLLSNPNPTHRPAQSYVGTFFAAAGIYPAVGLSLAWPANNVSGQTKRATATAMQISIGNLGAVMGTQLYRPKWTPHYYVGHAMALAYLVGNIVVVGTQWFLLHRDNQRKAALDPNTVDESELEGDEKISWKFNV
jgi:MFS family permease